ncbi:MAG: type II toxin-antitoxin system VapC family toxin [Thermodesulfovibrionales bacterium]
MDIYILDTDICIYWLKGNDRIEKKIVQVGLSAISITVITECELFYGAFKSTKKEKNLAIIEELKSKINTLHTTEGVSYIYGKLKSELGNKGQTIDDAALLIASIALSNTAILVTNNISHFKRIPGLKIENWK